MSRRHLFALASVAVLLGAHGAFAERLGGSYRGPEDQAKAEQNANSGSDAGTGGGSSSSSGGSKGDSGSGSGGTGAGGDSGSGGGGSGSGSGSGSGGSGSGGSGSGGSGSGGGGPDAGGGGSSSGKSGGGGGGGDSSSGAGGGGAGGASGPKGKGAAAQTQFLVAPWYFEHNREQILRRYQEGLGHHFQVPIHCSATILGVLPRDMRRRAEITTEDKDKIFTILKNQLQLSTDAVVRDAAVMALGKLGTPAAVELLKLQVQPEHEKDKAVRQDALLALGMSRSPEASPILIDAIKNDRRNESTSFALLGLGLSGDAEKGAPAALEYFTANVKKGNDQADAVACAAIALGMLRSEAAVKPLSAALKNKDVPDLVRCYCAQALGRIKGPDAQKALLDTMAKSGEEVERAAAAALGGFADKEVARALASEGLGKTDGLAAGFAAVSLGRVLAQLDEEEWKSAPEELRKAAKSAEKGGAAGVKAQYANIALSFFGGFDQSMLKWYDEKLKEPGIDKDVQSALAMAAGLGNLTRSQAVLGEIAGNGGRDKYARSYASMAFGMLGQGQAADAAKQLQDIFRKNEDATVRRGAIFGLGFVGDRDDVPFLISVIETTRDDMLAKYTRGAAVIALGTIRDGESITRIQSLTGNADKMVRAYAVAALGYLAADETQTAPLAQIFEDANFRTDKSFPTLEAVMHQL